MDLVRPTLLHSKGDAAWESRRREKLTHPPERVWKALTEPTELARWWCEEARVEGCVGGLYDFAGKTVFRPASAHEVDTSFGGEIVTFDAPHRLEFRWRLGDTDSLVRYELESHLEQTELTVTQSADRCPGWNGAEREPNWWWLALSTLREYVEDGRADLRLDYERLLEGAPLSFEVRATTFPWVIWSKLTSAKELGRWWQPTRSIDLSPGGAFEFVTTEASTPHPTTILEVQAEGESGEGLVACWRLVHDWCWDEESTGRIEWTITETDEDTLVRVRDLTPPGPVEERLRRGIFWSSRLLYLVQLSEKGSAPPEYQDPFQPQRPPGF